jgi:hypothetical protein
MVSNIIWNEVNKLPFSIHEEYDFERDKIFSVVMDYLESKRKICSTIPIGYVTADKVHKFVYDDFSRRLDLSGIKPLFPGSVIQV